MAPASQRSAWSAGDRAGSRQAGPGDLPVIRKLDAQASGADRASLLERLPGFAEQLRVVERHGLITGYAGAWRNVDNVIIGPVIAESMGDAKTLMADLAGIVRNTCRTPQAGPDAPTFEVLTTPNSKQQRAFELLQQITL